MGREHKKEEINESKEDNYVDKIVDQLIKEGCIVIATTRKDAPKKIPKKLKYYKIDVTSQSEWNALSKYIKKCRG